MNEKKYIDINPIIYELENDTLVSMSEAINNQRFAKWLKQLPAADVAEVKHGKWERSDKEYSYYQYKCSNCGCDDYTQTDRNGQCKIMDYCPNCGAKMGGAKK